MCSRANICPKFGATGSVNEQTFRAQEILQDFLSLVTRHWNAVSQTLRSGNIYTPLLIEDENGVSLGNDWANGFLRGMELRREAWAPLLDDEDRGGSLVAMFALAHEHDPDPELRSYDKPITPELREKLILGVAVGVMQIYRYFETRRLMPKMPTSMGATYRRGVPKVGRNDPCPCGSGRSTSSAVAGSRCIDLCGAAKEDERRCRKPALAGALVRPLKTFRKSKTGGRASAGWDPNAGPHECPKASKRSPNVDRRNSERTYIDVAALWARLCPELLMIGRFTNVSKFVFGPPHTFGWVRCSEIGKNGLEAWERPDGTTAWLSRGAQLGRLPGSRSRPVVVASTKAGK